MGDNAGTIICEYCEHEASADSDFCPYCGFLFEEARRATCSTHPLDAAIGVCIICQRLLCESCSEICEDRIFCSKHQDVLVEDEWALVFESTDVAEAELVKSVLESAGHHVQGRGFGSIGYVWDGGGESALSRSLLGQPARLYVPIPEFLRATETFEDWRSAAPN